MSLMANCFGCTILVMAVFSSSFLTERTSCCDGKMLQWQITKLSIGIILLWQYIVMALCCDCRDVKIRCVMSCVLLSSGPKADNPDGGGSRCLVVCLSGGL